MLQHLQQITQQAQLTHFSNSANAAELSFSAELTQLRSTSSMIEGLEIGHLGGISPAAITPVEQHRAFRGHTWGDTEGASAASILLVQSFGTEKRDENEGNTLRNFINKCRHVQVEGKVVCI